MRGGGRHLRGTDNFWSIEGRDIDPNGRRTINYKYNQAVETKETYLYIAVIVYVTYKYYAF